jgi:hypothetical protein
MSDERVYFCETKVLEITGDGNRGWPEMPVFFHCIGGVGKISHEDFRDITIYSWQDLMDNCGLDLRYTTNAKTANVVLRGKEIDGPGKTLGRSYLPIGLRRNSDMQGDNALRMEFDFENLSSDEIAPQGKLSAPAIWRHEGLHGLCAIAHAPDDSGALMRAFLDRKVSKMQAWDIREAQKVAGPPKKPVPPVTPPPQTPTTPGETVIRIRNGVVTIDNARITWLDR